MTKLNNNDYLKMLQNYVDQQYGDSLEDYDIEAMEWMPADPPAKEKIKNIPLNNGTVDLTDVKSDKIKEEMVKCTNLKIGKFKIKVSGYRGLPYGKEPQLVMNLEVWEEKTKTPNGHPCRMEFPLRIQKDDRFNKRDWIKYFDSHHATNVPVDTVVEIIRWMQVAQKLSAFF